MPAVLQHETVTLVTRTGRQVTIRPCTPADAPLIAAMYAQLSPRTLFLRYCSYRHVSGEEEAARLCGADPQDLVVLLALSEGEVVGIAELGRIRGDCGEAAIVVRDDCQGQGIGTALGRELISVAREMGIHRLQAYMLAENHAMRRLIAKLPFRRTWEYGCGELCVTLEIDAPAEAPV